MIFGFELRYIRVSLLVKGSDTLEYYARIFEIRFLGSTVTFNPIWLAQIMRNQNSNLMVQSDLTKIDGASQETHLKILSVIL